jgi:hypothetical protein
LSRAPNKKAPKLAVQQARQSVRSVRESDLCRLKKKFRHSGGSRRISVPRECRCRIGAGIDLIWRRIIFPHLVLVFAATITRSAAAAGAGREGSTRTAPLAPYDDLVQFIGGDRVGHMRFAHMDLHNLCTINAFNPITLA